VTTVLGNPSLCPTKRSLDGGDSPQGMKKKARGASNKASQASKNAPRSKHANSRQRLQTLQGGEERTYTKAPKDLHTTNPGNTRHRSPNQINPTPATFTRTKPTPISARTPPEKLSIEQKSSPFSTQVENDHSAQILIPMKKIARVNSGLRKGTRQEKKKMYTTKSRCQTATHPTSYLATENTHKMQGVANT